MDQNPQRRYDIDWLRIFATLAVFFFHNVRFFDTIDWHIKNAEPSEGMFIVVAFLNAWIMPIFFLISGAGSWFGLEARNWRQYLLDRSKRLLVPFYTVGAFILIPPQYFWDRVTKGLFEGAFTDFYPTFFYTFHFDFPFLSYWSGHLWFLRFLFLISLLTLPLLLYFKSSKGRALISKLAALINVRGGIFLFIIPIFLVELLIKPPPGGNSTSNFFYYLLFFIIGYLIPADRRFTESLEKNTRFSLVSGIAAFCLIGIVLVVFGYDPWDKSFSAIFLLVSILVSINTWCWIAYILGMGMKHFNKNNKVLVYGSQAVLPFYILHQTIILFVGWYIIPLDMFFLFKYLIISTVSFVLIMLIYEVLIKRINLIRFLFGMRLIKAESN
jgi:peptidoglycan/LPS O-acetylase OafA/YrhL